MARLSDKKQFPVAVFDEEAHRFVGWDEMQQEPYRTKVETRLFRDLRHPFFWMLKAKDLHEAAITLWASVEPSAVAGLSTKGTATVVFMLGGMSIENIIKARRICDEAWPVSDRSYQTIASGNHRLDKQAVDAGFRTNVNDRLFLQILSHYVRWKGRYFLPKNIGEFRGESARPYSSDAELWNQYLAFYKKVYKQLIVAMRRWSA